MAVCASFYRNVVLLTQVVPPSADMKKSFREGMFDRPNTTGFIHVSHYLLTIYDAERFKKSIVWPVTCKKSETKYRNDVKDFLMVVAAKNPDVGFPAIATSHLFHASGSKFIMIMSKLSQVTLRAYVKRESTVCDIIPVPKTGAVAALTKKFLSEATAKVTSRTVEQQKILSQMEQVAGSVLAKQTKDSEKIKANIFEMEKEIGNVASNAPVHTSIKKRLVDINDLDVVKLWRESINERSKHIDKFNEALKRIGRLSNKVQDVLKNANRAKVLDGKGFEAAPAILTQETFLPPEIECLFYQLYKDRHLVLDIFFQLFHSLLNQLHQRVRTNGLEDPSDWRSTVFESQKLVNLILGELQSHLVRIQNLSFEAQSLFSQTKNECNPYDVTMSPLTDNVLLMPSPHINIDPNGHPSTGRDLQRRLELTPVEGAHKSLFSRYLRQNHSQPPNCTGLLASGGKGSLLLSRRNLAGTTFLNCSERQFSRPRTITPMSCHSSVRQIAKYSRLFSVQNPKNTTRAANASVMSLPSSGTANSTVITNAAAGIQDISEFSLDITSKSFSDIGIQFSTPGRSHHKGHVNKSFSTSEEDSQSAHAHPTADGEISKANQQPEKQSTDDSNTFQADHSRSQRRSIGDLVERYKKLLETRNCASSPQVACIQQEDD